MRRLEPNHPEKPGQGPHSRQRGLYRLDATPVGKPSPDTVPDFEPVVMTKLNQRLGCSYVQ